jgi:hypothetical protein
VIEGKRGKRASGRRSNSLFSSQGLFQCNQRERVHTGFHSALSALGKKKRRGKRVARKENVRKGSTRILWLIREESRARYATEEDERRAGRINGGGGEVRREQGRRSRESRQSALT